MPSLIKQHHSGSVHVFMNTLECLAHMCDKVRDTHTMVTHSSTSQQKLRVVAGARRWVGMAWDTLASVTYCHQKMI